MNTICTMRTLSRPWLAALGVLMLAVLVAAPSVASAESCTGDPWSPGVAYQRGDIVSYENHEWRAKRASEGVVPGTHKPTWQDLGACSDEPPTPPPGGATPIQIFGVWHAGNNYADWALPRELSEFDEANHWLIDRGDGRPSVNLVVLSFLHPMQVLDMNPADPTTGVPVGMTQEIVDYFKDEGIRVMMSIGGVTYTDAWDEALDTDPVLLGLNAAAIAQEFGVGIEIDYERNTGANLIGLQAFVDAYRSVHPYDSAGTNHAARFTIDLAAGGRYLQELNRYATINWLDNANPVCTASRARPPTGRST
jgi:hypothetical protein